MTKIKSESCGHSVSWWCAVLEGAYQIIWNLVFSRIYQVLALKTNNLKLYAACAFKYFEGEFHCPVIPEQMQYKFEKSSRFYWPSQKNTLYAKVITSFSNVFNNCVSIDFRNRNIKFFYC